MRQLHGLAIWDAGRATDMLWLGIGAKQIVPTQRDPLRVVGEIAFHVSCAWRVSGRDGIVTGRSDIYACSDPTMPEWEFEPLDPGKSVVDTRLRAWIAAYAHRPLVVLNTEVDRCGGVTVHLSEGYAIEVFPTATGGTHEAREQWRLFRFEEDARHFVVTDRGIQPRAESVD